MDCKPSSAEEIKKIRKALGMTQREFANEFNFSIRTVQEWEQGRAECKPHILDMIYRISMLHFGVCPD